MSNGRKKLLPIFSTSNTPGLAALLPDHLCWFMKRETSKASQPAEPANEAEASATPPSESVQIELDALEAMLGLQARPPPKGQDAENAN